jgi:hypothetical protein
MFGYQIFVEATRPDSIESLGGKDLRRPEEPQGYDRGARSDAKLAEDYPSF